MEFCRTLWQGTHTPVLYRKSFIFWEWEGKCSAFDELLTWQPSLSFQLPLDALTGGWRFQGITCTNNSTYTCFGRYTNHTSFLATVTNWRIFCFCSGWICEFRLENVFSLLLFLAIKTIPCQRPKCIICCLGAKIARWKGKGVLYDGELLHFPASQESKESVSECCKCSREIHPHWSTDSSA